MHLQDDGGSIHAKTLHTTEDIGQLPPTLQLLAILGASTALFGMSSVSLCNIIIVP